MARAFIDRILSEHGLPSAIVLDRGSKFISKFWKHLTTQLGISLRLSTAYHPETDGQTERTNQSMELYLRIYCDYHQTNWARLLGPAAFAYNNTIHSATKTSPFFANFGYHPRWVQELPRASGKIQEGSEIMVKELSEVHKLCTQHIQEVNKEYSKYANQHRMEPPEFQVGDWVLLKMSNIKTKRPSRKLDWKQSGPYEVVERINLLGYRLKLPPTANIHDVFHINRLERWTDPNFPDVPLATPPLEVEATDEYEVREVLDTVEKGRGRKRQRMYLVAWKGFEGTLEETTWEPEEHLREHAQEELEKFWEQRRMREQLREEAAQTEDA